MTVLQHVRHWWQHFPSQLEFLWRNPIVALIESILTFSNGFSLNFSGGELVLDRAYPKNTQRTHFNLGKKPEKIARNFIAGFFTVGNTGKVEIDLLFEGWNDRGEIAIFSLAEMDGSILDNEAFIRKAALRGASNSQLGYTLTRDRFTTSLSRELIFRPGDRFGIMFVSESKVSDILTDSLLKNTPSPLFSLATDKSDDAFLWGQIVDLTGKGDTFMMEDLRFDGQFEGNLIFKLRGAIGQAPNPDRLCA